MTDISNNYKEFVKEGLEEGLRENGRKFLELRKLQIVFDFNDEGVEVALGKTKVYSKVSAKIVEPRQARPQEGFLKFNLNL